MSDDGKSNEKISDELLAAFRKGEEDALKMIDGLNGEFPPETAVYFDAFASTLMGFSLALEKDSGAGMARVFILINQSRNDFSKSLTIVDKPL